jgi:bacterioferritin
MNLIALLNEDLALEYAAAIQYTQHAASLDGLYFAFTQELRDHADEELKHARALNEHITYLGGIPSAKVGDVFTFSDNVDMLKQDLESEKTAIQRYEERIGQAREAKDFCTESVLLGILKDEVSHATDLEAILDI